MSMTWFLLSTSILSLLLLVGFSVLLLAFLRLRIYAEVIKADLAYMKRDLESQAAHFDERLANIVEQYDLKLANATDRWIDTRQRWTVTANQFLIAKGWIRQLLDLLKHPDMLALRRALDLDLPFPPNVEEIPAIDERVHFEALDILDELRLDDLIAEVQEEQVRSSSAA